MNYLVIDLETTGLDAALSEIIEIGAVKIEDETITDRFQTFVKPSGELPSEITDLTGITMADLEDAPTLADAIRMLLDFSGDIRVFIAHNASFECSFLEKLLPFMPDWLDTIEIAQTVRPLERYYRLAALLPIYGLVNERPHRALYDALVTAELFLSLKQEFLGFEGELAKKLFELALTVESPLADFVKSTALQVLQKFPARTVQNFDSDSHFFPIDNSILQNNPEANDEKVKWDWQLPPDRITDFFAELSDTDDENSFEARPQQLEMSKMVGEAFSDHHALLVEAGTGTGKSLAYLLPAVLYAKGSNMQVFISTHTINLQEQLIDKDIPLLRKYCDQDFSAVVVKGRSNYICNRKWQQMSKQCTAECLPLYLRITHWLLLSRTGDVGELNLYGRDSDNFYQLASNNETCGSYTCPHYKHRCYVNTVRRQAAKANIIIINHSLLLATSLVGNGNNSILPPISNLIIDEAHQLEQVAEHQLSMTISQNSLEKATQSLWQRERFSNLIKMLKKLPGSEDAVERLEECNDLIKESRQAAKEAFMLSSDLMRTAKTSYDRQIRIVEQRFNVDLWEPIENSFSNLVLILNQLCKALERLLGNFENLNDPFFSVDLLGSFRITLSSLTEYVAVVQAIIDNKLANGQECVVWLEKRRQLETPFWCVCPADIKKSLAECLFADKLSLIMTSATLCNTGFDFFIHEVGLDLADLEIKTSQLNSPFDYQQNCRIFLAADVGDYRETSESQAQQEIADYLYDLILAADGRALVLFTSYAQQKGVYKLLKPRLQQEGINVLGHGISGSRSHILDLHRQNERSCILGVSSFWEGVDIQGEALSLLVIVKLPFNPPSNPITEAKFERLQAEGRNPFRDYSLPQAIIRFKQGFGRLIRSKDDRGVVCVLDSRIWSKSYGNKFLAALPDVPIERLARAEMADMVRSFLDPSDR